MWWIVRTRQSPFPGRGPGAPPGPIQLSSAPGGLTTHLGAKTDAGAGFWRMGAARTTASQSYWAADKIAVRASPAAPICTGSSIVASERTMPSPMWLTTTASTCWSRKNVTTRA